MKLTAALSVAVLASSVAAQTEPPICDPAETLPTGEQGRIGPFADPAKFVLSGLMCEKSAEFVNGNASENGHPQFYTYSIQNNSL